MSAELFEALVLFNLFDIGRMRLIAFSVSLAPFIFALIQSQLGRRKSGMLLMKDVLKWWSPGRVQTCTSSNYIGIE